MPQKKLLPVFEDHSNGAIVEFLTNSDSSTPVSEDSNDLDSAYVFQAVRKNVSNNGTSCCKTIEVKQSNHEASDQFSSSESPSLFSQESIMDKAAYVREKNLQHESPQGGIGASPVVCRDAKGYTSPIAESSISEPPQAKSSR